MRGLLVPFATPTRRDATSKPIVARAHLGKGPERFAARALGSADELEPLRRRREAVAETPLPCRP